MKRILDACCGSRMFWFNKENPDVEFVDIREMEDEAIWKSTKNDSVRNCSIHPTTLAGFTNLPFEDNTFYHVVFDPPHLLKVGENSWMAKKYGRLPDNWKQLIHDGFNECMRVIKPNGTLIFKWSEVDIPISEILKVIDYKPLYGHRSGKAMKTHWMAFIKEKHPKRSTSRSTFHISRSRWDGTSKYSHMKGGSPFWALPFYYASGGSQKGRIAWPTGQR